MKRTLLVFLLINLMLFACAPTSAPISTPAPSATPLPTATTAPTNTAVPTATPTPIPTIQVGDLTVPDPRVTNPELFDVTKTDSPIVEYANAFKLNSADVLASLHPEIEKPKGMPEFITMRTTDGVALIMATQNEHGEWKWQETTPGIYWGAQGKWVGFYMKSRHLIFINSYLNIEKFANGGILSLGTDVENGKPVNNARNYLELAKNKDMSFLFHYIAEPGKFPDYVTKENVDNWIRDRLTELSGLIKNNKASKPVLIEFNEAWATKGAGWNNDRNFIRDKYGEKWLEEYLYQALNISISNELIPNTDFFLTFNESHIFNNPEKQRLVHKKLIEARTNAFNRLITDPVVKEKLIKMGINTPEDIQILLGAEMHINLKGSNIKNFIPEPTQNEINSLADFFSDLGGVILTEVNPNGTDEQKARFLAEKSQIMAVNKNIKGIVLWWIVPNDKPTGEDTYTRSPTFLFDANGYPTKLFFELLRETINS